MPKPIIFAGADRVGVWCAVSVDVFRSLEFDDRFFIILRKIMLFIEEICGS